MLYAAVVAAATLVATPASAQIADLQRACANPAAPADARIRSCTTILEMRKVSPEIRAHAYNGRGNALSAKQEFDRAIADYGEALRLRPNDAVTYYNRGSAWHGKRDYDRAIADYDDAIRLNRRLPHVHSNRGFAWHEKRDYDRAIAD